MLNADQLSSLQRNQRLTLIQDTIFDVVVIGGGITGAGIALDAAARGLQVALFEKNDFAFGTSSRSTKLIHGGLRYLKQLEIGLVREVGSERAILHRNAPHIVHPKKMLLPIIKKGSLGKKSTSVGLFVYDLLAGVSLKERRVMLEKEQTLESEPLLDKDIVLGGGLYYEYQTDDARLTIEVVKTATELGAMCFNYCEVLGYYYKDGKAVGVRVIDHINNVRFNIAAKKIINATGPWGDELRKKDNNAIGDKHLQLTKGIHIVVPFEKLPLQQAIYFDVAKDNRMIFAIVRNDKTYIGTTDTAYDYQNIDNPEVNISDLEYLLNAVNSIFPSINLIKQDILSTWVGLRPLIHQAGKKPSEVSRKDELFVSLSGIITIAGGKLTGYRKMAERAVNKVVKELFIEEKRKIKVCTTDAISLSGGNFKSPQHLEKYITKKSKIAEQLGISQNQLNNLVYKYGKNTKKIINIYRTLKKSDLTINQQLLMAELHYTIENEMVTNLCDFFIRRTGYLYFEKEKIDNSAIQLVSNELAKKMNWDSAQKQQHIANFEAAYKAVLNFKEPINKTINNDHLIVI